MSGQGCKGGEHVNLANQCIGSAAGRDMARPTGDPRHARAAFPDRVFAAPQRAGRHQALKILVGIVVVTVI